MDTASLLGVNCLHNPNNKITRNIQENGNLFLNIKRNISIKLTFVLNDAGRIDSWNIESKFWNIDIAGIAESCDKIEKMYTV